MLTLKTQFHLFSGDTFMQTQTIFHKKKTVRTITTSHQRSSEASTYIYNSVWARTVHSSGLDNRHCIPLATVTSLLSNGYRCFSWGKAAKCEPHHSPALVST